MPAVSVVIPVYNAERYLDRCLDSALGQTLRDIEVICIDDASCDASANVLSRRAIEDSRLRIITLNENSGAAVARNTGLDAAHGEYIFFLDSDDWMDPDYLESMYDHARRTGQEVTINANYLAEAENATPVKCRWISRTFLEGESFFPPFQVQRDFLCTLWTRLYRRAYLDDNNIRFLPWKGGGEDVYFVGLAEMLQPRSYIFHGPYYHYFQAEGSLSHGSDVWFNCFRHYAALYKELEARSVPIEAIQVFYLRSVIYENPSRYDYIRSFLLDIKEQILANSENYTILDLTFVKAMLESPDYPTFQRKLRVFLVNTVRQNHTANQTKKR